MKRKSRLTWIVLLVAVLAVGIAVVGTIFVAVYARRQIQTAQTKRRVLELDKAVAGYRGSFDYPGDAVETPSALPRVTTPTETAPVEEPPVVDEAADQPQVAVTQGQGQATSVVVMQTDDGRTSLTIRVGEGQEGQLKAEPVRPMAIPTLRRAEQMDLTDEQRQLVEAYSNEFRPLYDAKMEDLRARMNAAFEMVRQAQGAGDEQDEAEGRRQIKSLVGEGQREVVRELDDQYIEGLKTVLTEEQITELQKGRDAQSAFAAFGYAETRQDGGQSTFALIEGLPPPRRR